MRPVVEDHPCLTLAEVKRAGGFGPGRIWVKTAGGVFRVRRVADGLEVGYRVGRSLMKVQVALKGRAATFGTAYEFLCPISGAPVRKLYLAQGRLGGRVGLGLDHLSRARPAASRQHRRRTAGQPKGVVLWGLNAPAQPVSTLDGWERGRGLQLQDEALVWKLRGDLHRARSGEICSTRSKAISDWGWAWMQAQLDCKVLDRLGLIEWGQRHAAPFEWELGHGDIERVLLLIDFTDHRSPLVVLRLFSGSDVSRQAIALEFVRNQWRFRCPVTGQAVRVLYARAARFASRRAQYLVLGEKRPAERFGGGLLVEDTWKPHGQWR